MPRWFVCVVNARANDAGGKWNDGPEGFSADQVG
jgi:hypothetical protein